MKSPLNIPRFLLLFGASVCLFALSAFAQSPDRDSSQSTENSAITETDEPSDQSGWVTTDYGTLYKDSSGHTVKGWYNIDGSWYYFSSEHMLMHGWLRSGSSLYYLDPDSGTPVTGWLTLDGRTYYFDDSGCLTTGWQQLDGSWYYFNDEGCLQTGWADLDGSWYYLNPDTGSLQTGWLTIDDSTYYLDANGIMAHGWICLNDCLYYFSSSGSLQTGWLKCGSDWFYLSPESGALNTGWLDLDEGWYYLRSNGMMARDWCCIDDSWYYFGCGLMATGWTDVGGYTYYLYTENDPNGGKYGTMAHDTVIDEQELLSDGHAASAIQQQMYDHVCDSDSSTGYAIAVDTTSCYVGIFTGSKGNWTLKYFWPCAPGSYSSPTVTGTFDVSLKGYCFDSYGSRCYYYTQFCGNYLFHSVLYNQYGQLTDDRVGMRLSHGCVRLPIENAKWIYNNIPTDTTVYVYE